MGEHSRGLIERLAAVPVHAVGRVVGPTDGLPSGGPDITVDTEFGRLLVRRAASCLLRPEVGDTVLVSGPNQAAAWVIAVLERGGAVPSRFDLGGDAGLSVDADGLRLESSGRLDFAAGGELRLTAEALTVRAASATALIDRLSAFGRELSASIGQVRLVGNLLETFVDRLTQFARNSLRSVEGLDQARSGTVDYRAEQGMSLHGRELMATAEGLVKIDGGQINVG